MNGLRDEWEALARITATPLLDHDWFLSSAEALYEESQLRIVVTRDDGALTGVAPLVEEATASGARLTLLGASHLYEPGGWLFASAMAMGELVDRVIKLKRPVMLQRVSAESPLCSWNSGLMAGALMMARNAAPSLGVDTAGSWDSYYSRLSSRTTGNLPRLRRKVEKTIGPVRVEHSEPGPAAVDDVLQELVVLEGSGWKGRRGSSLSQRHKLREFFRRYCNRAAARGRLRVAKLLFGSQAAAMELSVEAYGRMWQLKIGYDEAVAAYYPGLHLAEASIHAAFERRLISYEFLGVAEEWEERWLPESRHYKQLLFYPLGAVGMIGAGRDLTRALMRRASVAVRRNAKHES